MKRQAATILIILSLIGLAIPLAGCGGGTSAQAENSAPFYDDRVVTVRIVMSAEDWEYIQQNAMAEEYVQADFWLDGELVPDVAVRPKGNSSLMSVAQSGSSRMSLKVDFNFFNSARTFYGLKKINLNNGFSDPTFIRETLAYELFEQMGLPTPRNSFVDLWVNDTHLGLYTMVEQIDKAFLAEHFADSSGNLYKPEMPAAYLNWTEADIETQQTEQSGTSDNLDVNLGGGKLREIMEALGLLEPTEEQAIAPQVPQMPAGNMPQGDIPRPDRFAGGVPPGDLPQGGMIAGGVPLGQQGNYLEQMALKTNENNPDYSGLFQLLDVLNNEPDETFPEEIEKILDVDQVLRYLAVSTVLVHLDNYTGMGHNYYLYEVDGKFTIIPWDLNMAFGTFNSGLDRNGIINFYIDEPTAGPVAERPLVSRLLSVPAYLETYHGYLEELIRGPFSEEVMYSRIDELAELIRPYVAADELKFYSMAAFEIGLSQDIATTRQAIGGMTPIGLKTFIAERIESIRKQLSGELPAASGDGSGNGGSWGAGGFPAGQGNAPFQPGIDTEENP